MALRFHTKVIVLQRQSCFNSKRNTCYITYTQQDSNASHYKVKENRELITGRQTRKYFWDSENNYEMQTCSRAYENLTKLINWAGQNQEHMHHWYKKLRLIILNNFHARNVTCRFKIDLYCINFFVCVPSEGKIVQPPLNTLNDTSAVPYGLYVTLPWKWKKMKAFLIKIHGKG
jgi:hypothetical protein